MISPGFILERREGGPLLPLARLALIVAAPSRCRGLRGTIRQGAQRPLESSPGDRRELRHVAVSAILARGFPDRQPAGPGALRAPLKIVMKVLTRSTLCILCASTLCIYICALALDLLGRFEPRSRCLEVPGNVSGTVRDVGFIGPLTRCRSGSTGMVATCGGYRLGGARSWPSF